MAPNPLRFFFNSEPSYPKSQPSSPRPYGWNLRSWDKVDKEIDEDCAKAGYNDLRKYLDDLLKKDPDYLELCASLYQKCAAEHGDESVKCNYYKKIWLECKKAQNA